MTMMNEMIIRSYSELKLLSTFEERFRYLKLDGRVGIDTFGFDRIFNQQFYNSKEWKNVRNIVIARDLGCDLGVIGRDIFSKIIIHHMNPISLDDIQNVTEFLLNPEYLICTSHRTHNAIHFGDESILLNDVIERTPNDTCLWRRR